MAAFASDRRSGWVRVLVLILCALFIFATIATPPAYAAGETIALFGLAAVLSAATAALGFKLAHNAEGQATLHKMAQEFAGASIAAGLVLTGSKVNGLINGMQYIKMAVHNGKTYLDERIFAWCQQWLANNGVYDSGAFSVVVPSLVAGQSYPFENIDPYTVVDAFLAQAANDGFTYFPSNSKEVLYKAISDFYSPGDYISIYFDSYSSACWTITICSGVPSSSPAVQNSYGTSIFFNAYTKLYNGRDSISFLADSGLYQNSVMFYHLDTSTYRKQAQISNYSGVSVSSNNTGLSGTDTLGKDVIDFTLDQILEKLKEWAQDWYDAGADSVTNAATGAKDLPLSVATGAATANPALNPDDVYNPPFALPLPGLRSGETDTNTVEQGKENASAAETATTDVAENQTVIDSLVNWALGYISPDTGLFSKFPLCVPYDAYLLACASLGVDVVESDSIFSASPDDLSSIVQTGTDEQSEGFTPVLTISNDLTLDGYTYPLNLTIDLTEWTPLIKFVRLAISITVIAELIGAEYKRIKGK